MNKRMNDNELLDVAYNALREIEGLSSPQVNHGLRNPQVNVENRNPVLLAYQIARDACISMELNRDERRQP